MNGQNYNILIRTRSQTTVHSQEPGWCSKKENLYFIIISRKRTIYSSIDSEQRVKTLHLSNLDNICGKDLKGVYTQIWCVGTQFLKMVS